MTACSDPSARRPAALARHARRWIVLGALFAAGAAAAAEPAPAAASAPSVALTAGGSWHFSAPPPATLQAFDRDWGQFELRLPRQGFALPAPNCHGEIRLRWIALKPDQPDRAAKLEARWSLLQRLQALQRPGAAGAPEDVRLDLRYYTRRDAQGAPRLQYCNAFVAD